MKKRRPGKKPQPARRRSRPAKGAGPRSREPNVDVAATELPRALSKYTSVSPVDSGGDVDADWQRAQSSGEETVGGSVATPDQDVVDELARPLGVERPPSAPVITSQEILSARDRRRWRIEQHTEEQAREGGEA
jgi:Family of unknown function (DUF6335)